MSRGDDPPAVGHKKPPLHTRFQKGRSGNPSGRRKGEQAKQDYREMVLSRLVPMTIGGKRVMVTAREALYQKLLAMSFDGNLNAMKLLLKDDGLNDNKADAESSLSDEEREAMIARFIARELKNARGGGDD